MTAQVLVSVDRISVGQNASEGIVFDCLMTGISNDTGFRDDLNGLVDWIKITTDLGTSPMQYYDVIVSEVMAYLNTTLVISLKRRDIVVMGWDDARFYGTSAYEDEDDFLAAKTSTASQINGKHGWGVGYSPNTGTLFSAGSWSAVTTGATAIHPGEVSVSSGVYGTGDNRATVQFNRSFDAVNISRMNWIASAGTKVARMGCFIGLHGATYFASTTDPAEQYIGALIDNNSATTSATWSVVAYDPVNGLSSSSTGVSATTTSTENYIDFSIYQTSVFTSGSNNDTTFECVFTDLKTGNEYSFTKVLRTTTAVADFLRPQYQIKTYEHVSGGQKVMRIDRFGFALKNLVRVLPEY